jgi:hypothetical protein
MLKLIKMVSELVYTKQGAWEPKGNKVTDDF